MTCKIQRGRGKRSVTGNMADWVLSWRCLPVGLIYNMLTEFLCKAVTFFTFALQEEGSFHLAAAAL